MEFRIGQVRHIFEYLPPMTMQSLDPVSGLPSSMALPICGRCFKVLKDDPFSGQPGKLTPGAPKGSHCFRCGNKAYPCD
jgi:hypothetical protein